MAKRKQHKSGTPQVENRKARHDYHILDTLECGVVLVGSEVKSIREGKVSIAEGFAKTAENPLRLELFGMHIQEYQPAGHRQHRPTRGRILLAHKREIRKLHQRTLQKGVTLVPLKLYFKDGWVKVLIGVGVGKTKGDKRQTLAKKDADRDIRRAMSKRV
ncbi:MAG: SsrA-binding protein SmpB [Phycisphaerales bacterium JB038]